MTEFPSMREKPNSTQGKNGALKVKRPKKFMRTYGFLLLQTYTSMMVNAWPRKTKLTNRAMIWMQKLRNSSSQKFCKFDKIVVSDLLWHVFSPIHCRLRYYWIFKLSSNFWVYESYMKPQSFKIQMNQWYSSDLNSAIGWLLLLILWTKSHIAMNSKQILLFSQVLLYDIILFLSLFCIRLPVDLFLNIIFQFWVSLLLAVKEVYIRKVYLQQYQGYSHDHSTKHEHKNKVSSSSSERTLL